MLKAYASFHRRWKTNGKSNRKLRRRLALLFRDIKQHAAHLTEQQWTQICDGLKGQLHTRSPWSLFRHLLNPNESKLEHNKALIRLLKELPGDEASICSELRERYLDAPPLQVSPSQRYEGDPNPTINRPIEEAEVRAVLHDLRPQSAPDADRVSNKTLRNLDEGSITTLTDYFNKEQTRWWKSPEAWGWNAPPRGLPCSSRASFEPKRRWPKSPSSWKDQAIPKVPATRVLGAPLHTGRSSEIGRTLRKNTGNTTRLIRRVSGAQHGLGEQDTCRLVQAFVLSRVTYAAPYKHLPKTARNQIDAIIRKSYKVALGLPNHTSTARFDQLGIHNTSQELCDAQRVAQISRLSRTPTSRRTLHRAGINYKDVPPPKWDMQPDRRRAVVVRPLPTPRNMSTTHHKQRREVRARALQRLQEDDPRAFHVNASPYPDRSKS
ncbi:hypothetical protein HPB47_002769 [Ixodes persulcatus]|uniref:Uncharacterized protein n=1 Tax=Ixodes persulcatus TaxID=34615 RepID=A0AC60PLB4_IXOPE|nr:hypothetical protein HPB47_002769 [Ixodes persulcatus]